MSSQLWLSFENGAPLTCNTQLFLTPSSISLINDRILLSTNQHVVLTGLPCNLSWRDRTMFIPVHTRFHGQYNKYINTWLFCNNYEIYILLCIHSLSKFHSSLFLVQTIPWSAIHILSVTPSKYLEQRRNIWRHTQRTTGNYIAIDR